MQVQQQQITPQQSQSQLESQESLVQSQLADDSDQVPHSSRKQKIKQVMCGSFSRLKTILFTFSSSMYGSERKKTNSNIKMTLHLSSLFFFCAVRKKGDSQIFRR